MNLNDKCKHRQNKNLNDDTTRRLEGEEVVGGKYDCARIKHRDAEPIDAARTQRIARKRIDRQRDTTRRCDIDWLRCLMYARCTRRHCR